MPAILRILSVVLLARVLIESGATVLDHLPHGSFFHVTGGSIFMDMKERLL